MLYIALSLGFSPMDENLHDTVQSFPSVFRLSALPPPPFVTLGLTLESLEPVCVRSRQPARRFPSVVVPTSALASSVVCWSHSPTATVLSLRSHAGSDADCRNNVRIFVGPPSIPLRHPFGILSTCRHRPLLKVSCRLSGRPSESLEPV